MNKETITIKDAKMGIPLATAVYPDNLVLFEGAWYFDAKDVDMKHLVVTERTYACPYKGICYWIDLATAEHQAKDVAFTYFKTNPGYEFIQDKIGFYSGQRDDTVEAAVVH